MMRKRLDLNGEWEFLHAGSEGGGELVRSRRILVPSPWQARFTDLRMKAGVGVYKRKFDLTPDQRIARMFVVFGAVFHNAKVWLNGQLAGRNEGGFLPFALEVSEFIVEGENELVVRAESPTDNPSVFPDDSILEIPFGKQSWYGPLSGIWQDVYLEARSRDFMDRARIVADLKQRDVGIRLFLYDPLARDAEIAFIIMDPRGAQIAESTISAAAGQEEFFTAFSFPEVEPWSPDQPRLYSARIAIRRDGQSIDEITRTFGFRAFEAREGRFYLNGEPFYMRGALDQDYYPETICTTPSADFLEDQFRKAKALGLNLVRCHIKVADPLYYEVADRVGILVWAELPNGGISTERSRARKERLLKGMVDRDSHHPSIVIWTIINENWGVDLVHDASHREWLKQTWRWLKSYDPTRLAVDNSPLAPSFHIQTDIADFHFYAGIPDHKADWDAFVDDLAARASWLFSDAGDAVISGEEPLVCSEFGNWGLPDPTLLADEQGREPWWFETGHDWGDGVMYPHGVENRFNDWSLDQVFGGLSDFAVACQWQQFRALKYEIEAMRGRSEIAGYVITELTDVHWEANGLLDMQRNPRAFHETLSEVNADIVVLPKLARPDVGNGPFSLELAVADVKQRDLRGAHLEVQAFGTLKALELDASGKARAELSAPARERPYRERIDVRLVKDGEILAKNAAEIAVFPEQERASPPLRIWCQDADWSARMAALGHSLSERGEGAELAISAKVNADILKWVRLGGNLLLVAEAPMALQPLFPHWQAVNVQHRDKTVWRGDWASSFSWLRRAGPFADIPGDILLTEMFDAVNPDCVITGCDRLDFQSRVHAGMAVGWIHKPVALTVERAYGRGHFVATTFRLRKGLQAESPLAEALLRAHMNLHRRRSGGRNAQGANLWEPGNAWGQGG